MGRPKQTLAERVERLTDNDNMWRGQVRDNRPHLDRVGNPVRVRLGLLDHPDYRVYADHPEDCPDPTRCVNIHHYRVVPCHNPRSSATKIPVTPWDDPRAAFTGQELTEIEENLPLLQKGEITEEDLGIFPKPRSQRNH